MSGQISRHPLKILLAYDGSEHSQAALKLIRDLDLLEMTEIKIIGVLIPRESSNHAILQANLDYATSQFAAKFSVTNELHLGYPSEQIIEIAENYNPHLIVLGAKGLRASMPILLGSVAQQVVEYVNLPTLIVRHPYQGLKNIMLVTDGSASSEKAVNCLCGITHPDSLEHCIHFPLPKNSKMIVVHVLPPLPSTDLIARSWPLGPDLIPAAMSNLSEDQSWIEEEELQGKALVDKTVAKLQSSGIDAIGLVLRGDAATEIIGYVKEKEIDLIVAGSRGLNPVKSWLLGSVSRKLIHYATCSTLVVKG